MKGLSSVSEQSDRPLTVTLLGETGVGKTSLAAMFPKPVILTTEDGTRSIQHIKDVMKTDLLVKSDDVREWMKRIAMEKHDRKTLIVDSITMLEQMVKNEIIARAGAKTITSGTELGFGRGLQELGDVMCKFHHACQSLRDRKGMHIVYCAHASMDDVRPEDDESYTRLTMQGEKRSIPPFTQDVDICALVRLRRSTHDASGHRIARGTGDRELICHATPSAVTKNRLGIRHALKLPEGSNPILNEDERQESKPAGGSL